MRNARHLAVSGALAVIMMGCGSAENAHVDGSGLTQLTEKLIKCDEFAETQVSQNLTGMPERFVRRDTWREADLKRGLNALAGIPDEYLKWLYQVHNQNGFYISQQTLSGSVVGVTYFTDLPLRINITTQSWAADFAMQHEVGHAIHVKLARGARFDSELEQLYAAESGNRKLRSYARTSASEYFAESFNNFYCGKEANDFVKTELPRTYDFLKANLAKPRWETDTTQPLAFDLWLKLGDGEESYISAPQGTAGVAVCKGDFALCSSAPREDVRFSESPSLIVGRKVFKSITGIQPAAGQVVTLIAKDQSGRLVGARTVRFDAR